MRIRHDHGGPPPPCCPSKQRATPSPGARRLARLQATKRRIPRVEVAPARRALAVAIVHREVEDALLHLARQRERAVPGSDRRIRENPANRLSVPAPRDGTSPRRCRTRIRKKARKGADAGGGRRGEVRTGVRLRNAPRRIGSVGRLQVARRLARPVTYQQSPLDLSFAAQGKAAASWSASASSARPPTRGTAGGAEATRRGG